MVNPDLQARIAHLRSKMPAVDINQRLTSYLP